MSWFEIRIENNKSKNRKGLFVDFFDLNIIFYSLSAVW